MRFSPSGPHRRRWRCLAQKQDDDETKWVGEETEAKHGTKSYKS